jgi:uncharacterized protein YsxB (DUF464 family)
MASHDFCPGCVQCDTEYHNSLVSTKIVNLKKVIEEVSRLEKKKITPKAKETLQATITMFELEIENLRKTYREYPKREKRKENV